MSDGADFMASGREFHLLVARGINDLSYKFVFDLGTIKFELLCKFLRLTWWTLCGGISVSKVVPYFYHFIQCYHTLLVPPFFK